jgi:hypothetical protein
MNCPDGAGPRDPKGCRLAIVVFPAGVTGRAGPDAAAGGGEADGGGLDEGGADGGGLDEGGADGGGVDEGGADGGGLDGGPADGGGLLDEGAADGGGSDGGIARRLATRDGCMGQFYRWTAQRRSSVSRRFSSAVQPPAARVRVAIHVAAVAAVAGGQRSGRAAARAIGASCVVRTAPFARISRGGGRQVSTGRTILGESGPLVPPHRGHRRTTRCMSPTHPVVQDGDDESSPPGPLKSEWLTVRPRRPAAAKPTSRLVDFVTDQPGFPQS